MGLWAMSYRGKVGLTMVTSHGYDWSYDIRPDTDDDIVVDEVWFENVYRVSPEQVAGKRVLDIGANIGAFSGLALAYGAESVIAFEPLESNLSRLLDNCPTVDGVALVAHQSAVGGSSGSIWFTEGDGSATGSGQTSEVSGSLEVPCRSFAEVLREAGDVAVLKMDIEGGEYSCFDSIEPADLDLVEYITMEFHTSVEGSFGRMVEKIANWGHVEILGRPEYGGQIYGRRY